MILVVDVSIGEIKVFSLYDFGCFIIFYFICYGFNYEFIYIKYDFLSVC
jgi:hypothetical protein